MQVRLKTGLKPGWVVEVDDAVGRAWLASGRAERVESEVVAEAVETPEQPSGRRRKARAQVEPETR